MGYILKLFYGTFLVISMGCDSEVQKPAIPKENSKLSDKKENKVPQPDQEIVDNNSGSKEKDGVQIVGLSENCQVNNCQEEANLQLTLHGFTNENSFVGNIDKPVKWDIIIENDKGRNVQLSIDKISEFKDLNQNFSNKGLNQSSLNLEWTCSKEVSGKLRLKVRDITRCKANNNPDQRGACEEMNKDSIFDKYVEIPYVIGKNLTNQLEENDIGQTSQIDRLGSTADEKKNRDICKGLELMGYSDGSSDERCYCKSGNKPAFTEANVNFVMSCFEVAPFNDASINLKCNVMGLFNFGENLGCSCPEGDLPWNGYNIVDYIHRCVVRR